MHIWWEEFCKWKSFHPEKDAKSIHIQHDVSYIWTSLSTIIYSQSARIDLVFMECRPGESCSSDRSTAANISLNSDHFINQQTLSNIYRLIQRPLVDSRNSGELKKLPKYLRFFSSVYHTLSHNRWLNWPVFHSSGQFTYPFSSRCCSSINRWLHLNHYLSSPIQFKSGSRPKNRGLVESRETACKHWADEGCKLRYCSEEGMQNRDTLGAYWFSLIHQVNCQNYSQSGYANSPTTVSPQRDELFAFRRVHACRRGFAIADSSPYSDLISVCHRRVLRRVKKVAQ